MPIGNGLRPKQNRAALYDDSKVFDDLFLQLIKNAKNSIHVQAYNFPRKIFEELLIARERGVEVYLLLDAVGSLCLGESGASELVAAGINFSWFRGISYKKLFKLGKRLQYKIILIDQEKTLVGGGNILSSYVDSSSSAASLDFMISLEGEIAQELSLYCERVFSSNFGKISFPKNKKISESKAGHDVGLVVNEKLRDRELLSKSYCDIIENAQESIVIINPFFFPRSHFIKKLIAAAKRGVEVRLVLGEYSDWPSWTLASEYLSYHFLKNGIEVYSWDKSILHGKLAIVDKSWMTTASFNSNYKSYQGSLELGVEVFSVTFCAETLERVNKLIATGCKKMQSKESASKFVRLKGALLYLLFSFISNFSLALIFQNTDSSRKTHKIKSYLYILVAFMSLTFGLIGLVIPGIVGFPFIILGVFILSRQVLLNKKSYQG